MIAIKILAAIGILAIIVLMCLIYKLTFYVKKQPQEKEEWEDHENTLFKGRFKFNGTPDLEYLIRTVKNDLYDGGNSGYMRARLVGVLRSMFWHENALFWEYQIHPRTYKIRVWLREQRRHLQRIFKTRKYRCELMGCKLMSEVINEETKTK